MNRNVPLLGFVIGLIFPILGLVVVNFTLLHGLPLGEFMNMLLHERDVASKVVSLSLLANLIPFVYYTSKRLDYTAKGIFIITMIFVAIAVLLKFNFFA
ncbi:MAG: hypothetical protein P4L41_08480 [Flavipsychrobacter sp.]|nr:hypothetical protein [Flavipsychrobacter sp.]